MANLSLVAEHLHELEERHREGLRAALDQPGLGIASLPDAAAEAHRPQLPIDYRWRRPEPIRIVIETHIYIHPGDDHHG